MGRGKDLSEQERNFIIKEIAKGKPQAEIASQIGRHLKTIKRFLADPKLRKERKDKGKLRKISARDVRHLKVTLRKNPGATSKEIFSASGVKDVSKSTRNSVLGKFAKQKKKPL